MRDFEFHEVSNIFSLMQGEEFQQLVADIQQHGLREPIWLYQGKIIDGRNRYRACQEAGIEAEFREWDEEGSLVSFVLSLNLHRRHLDESQRAMAGAKAKPLFEAEARERLKLNNETKANLPDSEKGQARDHAAKLMSVSPRLVESASKVLKEATPELVNAVEQGKVPVSRAEQLVSASPEFQKAVVKKLETGAASKPMEAIRQVKAEAMKEHAAVMPTGKYRVLYADPPWSYGNTQPDYHTEQRDHYPVMSLPDICALPIRELAEENAVLFLWVTSPILEESFQVIRAWGFTYKASFVWDKVKHNMGHYNSVRHELLLVCVRGSCQPDVRKLFDSVVTEEREAHSRKPAIFYDIIDTIYPHGKRIELFARIRREGWEAYGNDIAAVA